MTNLTGFVGQPCACAVFKTNASKPMSIPARANILSIVLLLRGICNFSSSLRRRRLPSTFTGSQAFLNRYSSLDPRPRGEEPPGGLHRQQTALLFVLGLKLGGAAAPGHRALLQNI